MAQKNFRKLFVLTFLSLAVLGVLLVGCIIYLSYNSNKPIQANTETYSTVAPSSSFADKLASSPQATPTCGTPCLQIRATAGAEKAANDVRRTAIANSIQSNSNVAGVVKTITIPPEVLKPYEVPLSVRAQDKTMNGKTSVWYAGAVISEEQSDYFAVYVWSGTVNERGEQGIGFSVNGPSKLKTKYEKIWLPTQSLAPITITSVTGTFGVISFKDANGKIGTLDMATGIWTIK
jgi:hypothetical protein